LAGFPLAAETPLAVFGFLCMVDAQRDKPQLPSPDAIAALKAAPTVAAFLTGTPS
jgi:hypothetical protein